MVCCARAKVHSPFAEATGVAGDVAIHNFSEFLESCPEMFVGGVENEVANEYSVRDWRSGQSVKFL
jgi:hypothetical protein